MLVGLFRPRIVVPRARFDALTAREQRMALCHELAHQRRADLWLGIVPALAERIFFFHPLARLASREYLVAREAACDADVVRAIGVSAQDYGQLLLTLGVAPVGARFAAAGTSRTFSNLKRRILMLGLPTPTRKVQAAGWLLTGLAALALVPVQLVGRAGEVVVPASPGADISLEASVPARGPQQASQNLARLGASREQPRELRHPLWRSPHDHGRRHRLVAARSPARQRSSDLLVQDRRPGIRRARRLRHRSGHRRHQTDRRDRSRAGRGRLEAGGHRRPAGRSGGQAGCHRGPARQHRRSAGRDWGPASEAGHPGNGRHRCRAQEPRSATSRSSTPRCASSTTRCARSIRRCAKPTSRCRASTRRCACSTTRCASSTAR